jgi:hypothetical protein
VDQSIGAIEHSQRRLMTIHEPLLHTILCDRKQEARPAELLEIQYSQTMRLRNVYY